MEATEALTMSLSIVFKQSLGSLVIEELSEILNIIFITNNY